VKLECIWSKRWWNILNNDHYNVLDL